MHNTNTVDYAVVYDGRCGWSLMTPNHSSQAAMSSCKTVHGTRGETKARSPLRCSFPEWRKSMKSLLELALEAHGECSHESSLTRWLHAEVSANAEKAAPVKE